MAPITCDGIDFSIIQISQEISSAYATLLLVNCLYYIKQVTARFTTLSTPG